MVISFSTGAGCGLCSWESWADCWCIPRCQVSFSEICEDKFSGVHCWGLCGDHPPGCIHLDASWSSLPHGCWYPFCNGFMGTSWWQSSFRCFVVTVSPQLLGPCLLFAMVSWGLPSGCLSGGNLHSDASSSLFLHSFLIPASWQLLVIGVLLGPCFLEAAGDGVPVGSWWGCGWAAGHSWVLGALLPRFCRDIISRALVVIPPGISFGSDIYSQ